MLVNNESKGMNAEFRELLGLKPVRLVIKKGRLRHFGPIERKYDADW